jgi:geranylgeranyl diphosphate synthase type I
VSTDHAAARHLPLLDGALREALARGPGELLRAARYVMGWENGDGSPAAAGGKRLRPLLCIEVAQACGSPAETALPGAVAVEFVHNFSLVHDDIQDRDVLRHGRPTAWQLIGEAQAINLGNFLYTRGLKHLAESQAPGAPQALTLLFDAVERMVGGQWADLDFERDAAVTETAYLAMVDGKTGALLGAAAGIGAVLAGTPAITVERLRQWGAALGVAFQVRDDYLGTWGDAAATGKSVSSDIARRKKTLPVVYALATPARARLLELYSSDRMTDDLVNDVLDLLESVGAREHTLAVARGLAARAEALLDGLGLPADGIARLRALGRFIVERDR